MTSSLLGRDWEGQGRLEEEHMYVGLFLKVCDNKVDALLEEGIGARAGVEDGDLIVFKWRWEYGSILVHAYVFFGGGSDGCPPHSF